MLLFGVTNPTALLGKAEATISWGLDVVAFAESSHTQVASRVIRSSFRKFGWKALLGHAVRDKFATKTGAASFRGLSKGVALASKWPCYDVVPGYIPSEVWQGGRLHLGCVHVGQMPIHVLTIYLMPNAAPGSFRFEINNAVLDWAAQVCRSLVGPVLLCGDFNAPLTRWPVVRGMLERGWVDLGLLQAEVEGCEPQPTCLGAARHTFQLANRALVQFWRKTYVLSAPDLDKHDVLVSEFDIPLKIPRVPKWVLPKTFLDGPVDKIVLDRTLNNSHTSTQDAVHGALGRSDVAEALSIWSKAQEEGFMKAACHCDGDHRELSKKYLGRCQVQEPKQVQLALPRCKTGRPGDYRPPYLIASTHVRQLVKQTRRLQRMWHILAHRQGPLLDDVVNLWNGVTSATGFGKPFAKWCISQIGWFPFQFPDASMIFEIYQAVKDFTDEASRKAWAMKREAFATEIEVSCAQKGSSLPCRLIKEETQPSVTEMTVERKFALSPQAWMPQGKSWVKIRNTDNFKVGDVLKGEGFTVSVLEIRGESVRLDRLMSRREAAEVALTKVEVSPQIWTGHFMKEWDAFWNRDHEEGLPEGMDRYLNMVPQLPSFELETITGDVLHEAIRGLKTISMRGCDGWAYGELKLLPVQSLDTLACIFRAIENGAPWPPSLRQWFLVLLRKDDSPVPQWNQIRPISVAAGLYRLWARLRAKEILRVLSTRATGLIKPNLPTTAIWGMLSDYLDWAVGKRAKPAGIVLDIVKAFNCLHRELLGRLFVKTGVPLWLWQCWENALASMTRRVQVDGYHFQANLSSTGIPEGDPLSVGGMWAYSYMFGEVVKQLSGGDLRIVCPVTYADNWEVWGARLQPIVDLLDPLAVFLRTCRLPVSVDKCWGWSLDPQGRRILRRCHFDDRPLPVVLAAKCLGADVAYSFQIAAGTRNKRVRSGGLRLVRLAGLPMGFHRRASVVRLSVWKQALHGAATSCVPRTVFKKLRSKLCRGLRIDRSGRSPWLVGSMLTVDPIDPEFEVLMDRIRLCRQLAHSVPEWRRMLPDLWLGGPGRYKGVTKRMLRQLEGLGWLSNGDGTFSDAYGRKFDMEKTSFVHVKRVLKSTWLDKVADNCSHRKGLEELCTLDNLNLRHFRGLDQSEAGLVRQSIVGAHITCDAKGHFVGSKECPLCGCPHDSRVHRFLECIGTEDLRVKWNIPGALRSFPAFSVTHGLFPEIDHVRIFQGALDAIQVEGVPRRNRLDHVTVFTDGSCLHPRHADLRVSAGAVIIAGSSGPTRLWSGLVLGQQGVFRGELLAGAVAVGAFHHVTVFSDCWAFVRKATRLLDRRANGLAVTLPKSHRDLWEMFWANVTSASGPVVIRWTPAHRKVEQLSGDEKWKALHNQFADVQAKQACADFVERCPAYVELVEDYFRREGVARNILKFHAQVAYRFVKPQASEHASDKDLDNLATLDGDGQGLVLPVGNFDDSFCPRYFGLVDRFFREATWAPASGNGILTDTSYLELYLMCTWAVGVLPPVYIGDRWQLVDEGRAAAASDLDGLRLFRTWRKVFDKWQLAVGSPLVKVGHCRSLGELGLKVSGAGVEGRFSHPLASVHEVGRACGGATTLGGLSVPFLY